MDSGALDLQSPTSDQVHARVLALAQRFGRTATSFQVLESGYRYFFHDAESCVAYVDTGRAWVAAGPPLTADDRMAAVALAFVEAARAAGRRSCFFGTEERFARLVPLRRLLVGEEATWDPSRWVHTMRGARSLREQLRRARAKGVGVRRIPTEHAVSTNAPTGSAIKDLVDRWHRARELPPLGFLARVEPLPGLPGQVLFWAERDGRLIGLLLAAPIFGRSGWLLQNLLRSAEAPNGTMETLVDHAMREAASSGRTIVTLGLAPLAGAVAPPLRLARSLGAGLYNFEGLRAFKAKLRPARWNRIFVSFPAEVGPVRVVVDLLAAFAHGSVLRFGLRTLSRGPAVLSSLLAVLLVPWTVLLALADPVCWFPNPTVKWAWVAFDTLLATGLFALRSRWRGRLARTLTVAIGADIVLTMVEGLWWNLPRATENTVRAILAVATIAPTVAFLVLSRATARRSTSLSIGRQAPAFAACDR